MSVAKDPKSGKWYCKFRYTDWTGARRQKKKEGFTRKSDAQAWENEFLAKAERSCSMLFSSMADIYMEDCGKRLRVTTINRKEHIIRTKLIPYFGSLPLDQITPVHVREWQNTMLSRMTSLEKPYTKTYLRAVNNELSAIMNYAVKYYGLQSNPARTAGSMGKDHADAMQFWTEEEFRKFIASVDSPMPYCIFNLFFYTGLREGELLALTLSDFDFENKVVHITKTYVRINGEDFIHEPKTPKSRRDITIPDFLCDIVKDYAGRLTDYDPQDRLFQVTKHYLSKQIRKYCGISGVKLIRIHDLRHSHASLLVNMGVPIKAISERLGHENIQTTLQTYSHLYPEVHGNIAENINEKYGTELTPEAWEKHRPDAKS